jgi:hypothetical protein
MARDKYDAAFFEAALRGFEQQKALIEEKMAGLRQELARIRGSRGSRSTNAASGGRRELSADARRRIAEAQRRRWARVRKEKGKSAASRS